MDYSRAMQILCPPPEAQWTCGDTYASIVRLDSGEVPSDASLQAAFAAYVPPKIWAKPTFWAKFTTQEQLAILTSSDAQVVGIRFGFPLKPNVQSTDQQLLTGMNYLVTIGILTQDRMNTILS